jgi:hypothetical protein
MTVLSLSPRSASYVVIVAFFSVSACGNAKTATTDGKPTASHVGHGRRACAAFRTEAKPFRTGAGLEDLVRMASGMREARLRLASRLRSAARTSNDQRVLVNLLRSLNDTRSLDSAEAQAKAGNVVPAHNALGDAVDQEARDIRMAQRRGLGPCLA